MLKFFRKIRQQLLSENHFSKYFLYGIGEILLVMIGILLALQVNNWNEARKNKETEQKILQSILSNLEEDSQTLAKVTSRYHLTLKNIKRLFEPLPIPDDSLAFISTRAAGVSNFIPITTAFDRSMSSGAFNLIDSDSVAQSIQRLYAFEYEGLKEVHTNLMIFQRQLMGLTSQFDAFDLKPLERKGLYDQNYVLPWNMENLRKRNESREFIALIKQINVNVHMVIRFYENAQAKNEAVQQEIHQYLTTF